NINPLPNNYENSNGINSNIIARVINASNCISFTTVDLVLDELPTIALNTIGSDTINCNQASIQISAEGSTSGNGIIYDWFNENGNLPNFQNLSMIEVNGAGWYYLQVTNEMTGCEQRDSIQIFQSNEIPTIELEQEIRGDCGQVNTTLEANISTSNARINWTTNDGRILSDPTLPIIDVEGEGTYVIQVINPENNCSNIDSITFRTIPTLNIASIEIEDDDCSNEASGSITINPIDDGNAPFTFIINEIAYTENLLSNLSAGRYAIQIIDANGCTLDTIANILAPTNFELSLPSILNFSLTDENILAASVNISEASIQSIQWSPSENLSCSDCLTPVLMNPEITNYTIEVMDINGCINSRSIEILFNPEFNIFIPNVFSPNGDNINDYFDVQFSDNVSLLNLTMQVFDRWGNKVFDRSQLQNAGTSEFWDGRFKGERMNPGVYIYIIKAELIDQERPIQLSGDITLIR
ncbi:MAG: gliding motility-associated C-terminal domain-containing protein, partial [Bacteroidota bacterium]